MNRPKLLKDNPEDLAAFLKEHEQVIKDLIAHTSKEEILKQLRRVERIDSLQGTKPSEAAGNIVSALIASFDGCESFNKIFAAFMDEGRQDIAHLCTAITVQVINDHPLFEKLKNGGFKVR